MPQTHSETEGRPAEEGWSMQQTIPGALGGTAKQQPDVDDEEREEKESLFVESPAYFRSFTL